jgi:hypothetical protein
MDFNSHLKVLKIQNLQFKEALLSQSEESLDKLIIY